MKQRNARYQNEIFCLSRNDGPPISDGSVRTVSGDFLQTAQMASVLQDIKPNQVFHLAWETTHGTYWNAPVNRDWADATVEFAHRFAELGGQHFTFATTCAEYEWGDETLDETTTAEQPATLYGREKLRTTRALTKLGENTSVTTNCSRIFFPFCEQENKSRITSLLIRNLLADQPLHLRAGDVFRDIFHTRHVAKALINMAQVRAGGTYNISRGMPLHLGTFLKAIAREMNKEYLVTWDDWQPGNQLGGEPRHIAGSHQLVAPYLTGHIDMQADIKQFVRASIKRFS